MKSFERPYDLSTVRISLASPHEIRSFSYGEVTNSKSINYKTMAPERGGIFCEVIFGPLKDYECSCGALQGIEFEGKVCQSCGVEVSSSRVRRYRMGHIELSAPIAHLWYFKVRPFYLNTFLNLRLKDLENILSSSREVIFHVHQKELPGKRPYERKDIEVIRGSGHEVLQNYLSRINLAQEYLYHKHTLSHALSDTQYSKVGQDVYTGFIQSQIFAQELKKFRQVYFFMVNKRRPEWMMFTALPVLPPELRPFLMMANNLVISSDLNLLYKKILDRNRRLKSLRQLSQEYSSTFVTTSFVYNEISMLQHSVDCLIDNGRRGKPFLNKKKLPLKSLAHILKGKEGRFRMNLLGKRVDLSGRTVISVGPRLKLTQCGLPLLIAVNLFQSFLYKKLPQAHVRKLVQLQRSVFSHYNQIPQTKEDYKFFSEVLSMIDQIVYAHPILLNRAPTLHRLNVQAFQPIVINNKAIQLHPLVCSSFNADFDGDQMAVHVPLSLSSQIESRILMMTYNNIISPSNGSVLIMPSQDVIFGLYYASLSIKQGNNVKRFTSIKDVRLAMLEKYITVHTEIYYLIGNVWKLTTPGRVLLYYLLEDRHSISFDMFNTILTKKKIQDLLKNIHETCLREDFLYFLDQMMAYGFYYAHQAGISMTLSDVVVPSLKSRAVANATEKSSSAVVEYKLGNISNEEKTSRVIREWSNIQEYITSTILRDVHQTKSTEIPPIYMLIYSGARGSILQMRQLSGLRGLMVKPSGETIEMPIASNFKEGLKVLEYFHSTHGARKGVIDTSIRTATSGYLTRRLVHASQGVVVTEEDCGTSLGIEVRTEFSEGKETTSLYSVALGRLLAQDVYNLDKNKLLYSRNTLLNSKTLQNLAEAKVESIYVRTPLTCQASRGVCQACYGSSLSSGKKVLLGEPVGILAAQSIGEPGTQLTMRTFHMGGVLQGTSEASAIYAKDRSRVYLKNAPIFELKHTLNSALCVSRNAELFLLNDSDQVIMKHAIPYGSVLYVCDGEYVAKGSLLFKWNPNYEPIINTSLTPSVIVCRDFLNDQTYKSVFTSVKNVRRILHHTQEDLFPRLVLTDAQHQIKKYLVYWKDKRLSISRIYYLQEGDLCFVSHHETARFGQLLYLVPRRTDSTVDITGGLSRISQYFESSLPSGKGKVLSSQDGFFFVHPSRPTSRMKWKMARLETSEDQFLPADTKLKIRTLTYVRKGHSISLGIPSFEEMLEIHGTGKAVMKFKESIQSIYRANGVTIHDKHLDIVLNRMYGRLTISDPGQTGFLMREEVSREDFFAQNIQSLSRGLRAAKGRVVVRGVTYISLESSSFLSAAAFQNTSFVLAKSAIQGKTDYLQGLSENVILGRLSPIGTGAVLSPTKQRASQ